MGPSSGPYYPIMGVTIFKLLYLSRLKIKIWYTYCSYKIKYNYMQICK